MKNEKNYYKIQNLGVPTDYSNEENQVHLPENTDKAVDTFFIYPTLYINPEPIAPTIVPVEDPMLRAAVNDHYGQAPILFEDLTNLYEPYYRQSNLCALEGKGPKEIIDFNFANKELTFMLHQTTFLSIIIKAVHSFSQDTPSVCNAENCTTRLFHGAYRISRAYGSNLCDRIFHHER